MKKIYSFLLCIITALTANAQIINGDLNHNDGLDVEDVTLLIDGYLTGETELVSTDPFTTDNSRIVGTWHKSTTESVTFNADGTTDYANGYTYEFLPIQGFILFYNAAGSPVYTLRVIKVTEDALIVLPAGSNVPVLYSASQPVSITLSATFLKMKPNDFDRLIATVEPSDAGTVTWSSSDENVATVMGGFVTAVADGTTIITAEVAGAKATCRVEVVDFTPITNIEISSKSLTLWAGDGSHTLSVTITPSNATNKTLTWSSSKTSVATVNNGIVTPQSSGTTTITCSTNDGSGLKATCDITVKPLSGTNNGYTWVDLGLSVKWATMNVDATYITDYGKYYMWGEIYPRSYFIRDEYKYYDVDSNKITKYNDSDGKKTLNLSDDVAHQNLGNTWRMPTYDEASELGKNCTWTWTTKDGVKGFEVTSKVNSNSIFLPAAGYYIGSSNSRAGDTVHFWTSSLNNSWNAWRLSSDNMNYLSYTFRYYGFPVRAVCP